MPVESRLQFKVTVIVVSYLSTIPNCVIGQVPVRVKRQAKSRWLINFLCGSPKIVPFARHEALERAPRP
jgi:hypothetical protein